MSNPDPAVEIRMTTLHATRGANFWSRHPVMRMDIAVGAYEDISSADVPGFTDALVAAMPGLEAHRCSIGERGGSSLASIAAPTRRILSSMSRSSFRR